LVEPTPRVIHCRPYEQCIVTHLVLSREGTTQQTFGLRVAVHHESDLVEPVAALVAELSDALSHLTDGLLLALLDRTKHDAHTDRRERDGLVARVGGRLQACVDDVAQRPLQVIDHEDHVGEGRSVRRRAMVGHDSLSVGEGHRLLRLPVEQVAHYPLDDAVDSTEPHATRVDGSDESIGLDSRDVTGLDFDLHLTLPLYFPFRGVMMLSTNACIGLADNTWL